jgi:hypothetical protein
MAGVELSMSRNEKKVIGFIIGRERDLPEAVIAQVNSQYEDVTAEMVKIGGTFLDDIVPYDVIIDRMSHEIPYYRTYVKYAALQGCDVINDPFVWSNDSKFFAGALLRKLGLHTPRTMVLPNKEIAAETVPDSYRNLIYPMDWQAIVGYIGSPAIFKDVRSGGRRFAHRVNSVEDLIQRYDESGTRTMILQQVIESDQQIHCLVIGREKTMLMPYSLGAGRYLDSEPGLDERLKERVTSTALTIAEVYGYDINMSEYVVRDGEIYLINGTNPSPVMDRELMTAAQFDWIVREIAELAVSRARNPVPLRLPIQLPSE